MTHRSVRTKVQISFFSVGNRVLLCQFGYLSSEEQAAHVLARITVPTNSYGATAGTTYPHAYALV
jgi:hypothetical protein